MSFHTITHRSRLGLALEVGFYALMCALVLMLFAGRSHGAPPAATVQRSETGVVCADGKCGLGAATVAGPRRPAQAEQPGRFSPERGGPVVRALRAMRQPFCRGCR